MKPLLAETLMTNNRFSSIDCSEPGRLWRIRLVYLPIASDAY